MAGAISSQGAMTPSYRGAGPDEAARETLAGLYALVASCEANGVNPEAYLADVLLRVQPPNSRIGELLPPEWKRLRAADPPDSPLQLRH
ncbi:IS66 family transposase truncated [Corallococcus macrosporus]|uniref:IS66 family transposase truncated n=1 Tax=Myxococcus fulvus (strain ATCC BAA-855 / HW-1) TaxID=483219 RepID=F8CF44_MYXFH|nr:IS66 family transposase truncated [Corallococcus macrosporus]